MALTTFTLFSFPPRQRLWAFAQMGLARPVLKGTAGLRFWKMLGSGRGQGFSLSPDWGRYGLFAVWDTPAHADVFREGPLMAAYRKRAGEIWTVGLAALQARGTWSGANPFLPLESPPASAGPIAVLTRASIRPGKLRAFWSAAPAATRALEGADGLLASVGVGEAPFLRQATFSLWRDAQAIQAYSHGQQAHRTAMQRTRSENWYKEELFARFIPVSAMGAWGGKNPLEGLI